MQERFISICKNRHKYITKSLLKAKKIEKATAFDPGWFKDTDAYKSINLGSEYLYSYTWSPPTAEHFHKHCAKVSESDFAHVQWLRHHFGPFLPCFSAVPFPPRRLRVEH